MRFILSWVWLLAYAEEICYNYSMEKVMKKRAKELMNNDF